MGGKGLEKESYGKWGTTEASPLGATPSPVPPGAPGPALPSLPPAPGTSLAPDSPRISATGLTGGRTVRRGLRWSSHSSEAPPPRQDRDGADTCPTQLSGRERYRATSAAAPHTGNPRTRILTFSWNMDSMFICLEPTAPAPDHPLLFRPTPAPPLLPHRPRPSLARPWPRVSLRPIIPEDESHVERREGTLGLWRRRHVTFIARPLIHC